MESSQYSFHIIDYKLKKLSEHLVGIQALKEQLDISKEIHYFSSLFKYIEDSMEIKSFKESNIGCLKKILTNIEVSILIIKSLLINFKGSVSTMILIERSKVIIKQKFKILREDFRKNQETIKLNRETTGTIE
jgi:hypothetical protein